MKTLIYLYGGPGTGKSTTAAAVFALAKMQGINAELIREYVKNWVWEGRPITPGDQIYIAAKQSKMERICFQDVDLIVSDSPLYLCKFYEQKYDPTIPVTDVIIKKHTQIAELAGFQIMHVFLNRVKDFNPAGRLQTESEAIALDTEIKTMLEQDGVRFFEVDADDVVATQIMSLVRRIGL